MARPKDSKNKPKNVITTPEVTINEPVENETVDSTEMSTDTESSNVTESSATRKPYPTYQERLNKVNATIESLNRLIEFRKELVAKTEKTFQDRNSVKKDKNGIPTGEIFVSRKEKSITRSTVEIAYQKVIAFGKNSTQPPAIEGPKKLGVFEASYIYPIFVRLGIILPK